MLKQSIVVIFWWGYGDLLTCTASGSGIRLVLITDCEEAICLHDICIEPKLNSFAGAAQMCKTPFVWEITVETWRLIYCVKYHPSYLFRMIRALFDRTFSPCLLKSQGIFQLINFFSFSFHFQFTSYMVSWPVYSVPGVTFCKVSFL